MPTIFNPHLAEPTLKAAKNTVKVYNFTAKYQPDDYIPNKLEEEFDRRRDELGERNALDTGTKRARKAVKSLRRAVLTKTSLLKQAVLVDSLGKQSSPATQGGHVEAPMPQTNYAKNTLENEYLERLNKKQLAEMNKIQQQQAQNQQSSTQSTSSTTTSTTTISGLSNSGLMTALSVGSVM